MPLKEKYILVCGNLRDKKAAKPSCRGTCPELPEQFKAALARRGLKDRFRSVATSCLDLCETGPTVSVMPDGIWYQNVGPDDIEEIIDSHLLNEKPVERLLRKKQ